MNMKSTLMKTALFVLAGFSVKAGFAADAGGTKPVSQTHYPAGSQQSFKGPVEYFTGEVLVDMLFPENETAHYSGAYVTFAPGARTAWHLHPAGQHMIVTDGTALTGTRDGKVVSFDEGETVWCPPDIDHWHGATPDMHMTHLVITGSLDGENVIWKEKVSDADYHAAVEGKSTDILPLQALSKKEQQLIPVAAYTANGDLESLKTALNDGLDAGLSINEIKEAQIHLYAYVGFPRALNGLATLMGTVNVRKEKGIKDVIGKEPTPLPSDRSSLELGKEVQTQLAGRPVTGPLFDFAPGINTFLQSHLFGDLFGRGILDYQTREIVTLSALASVVGVEPQLKAHISIATNVGLTEEQLSELATVLEMTVGKTEGTRVKQAIKQVLHPEKDSL